MSYLVEKFRRGQITATQKTTGDLDKKLRLIIMRPFGKTRGNPEKMGMSGEFRAGQKFGSKSDWRAARRQPAVNASTHVHGAASARRVRLHARSRRADAAPLAKQIHYQRYSRF